MELQLADYYEISKQLRQSIDTNHCFDCPFRKRCNELYDSFDGKWDNCDVIRIKIIHEKIENYQKRLDKQN